MERKLMAQITDALTGRQRKRTCWQRTGAWTWLRAAVCAAVLFVASSLALGAPPVARAAQPQRVLFVIDNSASMTSGRRLERSVDAARAWLRALPIPSDTTVELATASSEVTVVGSYGLRSADDRTSALAGLDAVEARGESRTEFSAVDEGIEAVVLRDVLPSETWALVFLTDGISDAPAHDLRAGDLGERITSLGDHLYAIIGGDLPAASALFQAKERDRLPDRVPPSRAASGASRLRGLFAHVPLTLTAPRSILSVVEPSLWRGIAPDTIRVSVGNQAALPREVELLVEAPAGMVALVQPTRVVVGAGQTTEVAVEIESASEQASGTVRVVGRMPNGVSASLPIEVTVTRRSWLAANWPVAGLGIALLAVLALGAAFLGRRPLLLAIPGRGACAVEVRSGREVPLSTFDPTLPGSVVMKRRHGGVLVKSDGPTLLVGGVPATAGRWVPYRLREVLAVNGASIVIDRVTDTSNDALPEMASAFGVRPDGLR